MDIPIAQYGFVSIHAPVQGGDDWGSAPGRQGNSFNPRPRTRGRLYKSLVIFFCKLVSIHAPVQGGDQQVLADQVSME